MNAPDLFALLSREAPAFGIAPPEGEEAVFWNAYFRELREFRAPAIEHAFAAWKAGEFDPKKPILATIFPKPEQLAALARKWIAAVEFLPEQFRLPNLPDTLKPTMTREQMADRLRAMGKVPIDDVGVVL